MPYKRKAMTESRMKLKTEAKMYKPKVKLKKKVAPTRKWKDGKEVTHSDAKKRARYNTFIEFASEFSGAPSRKILKKK